MALTVKFRRQCRLMRAAALFVMVGLGLVLLMGIGGNLLWPQSSGANSSWGTHATMALVRALPGLGYMWALWAVQQALGDVAAGRLFHPTVVRALRNIGIGVLLGALLNVFAVINIAKWITDTSGSYVYFDLSGIVLAVVGSALIFLARVLDHAREIQDELSEIL